MAKAQTVHIPLEAQNWLVQREWTRLDELCDGVFDCPHSTPELTNDGPFVVRSQDVRTGIFRKEDAARISESTYKERIARVEPSSGDLLYSREGTYFGIAAEVPDKTRVCLGQRMVLIRPKRQRLNPRFLRLWLNSPVLSRHIEGFRDGTVAERLNMPTIRGLPIPVFDPKEQVAIAEILGSLDDKIELNRRMNGTLEAMAQALFKEWFVDGAKEEWQPGTVGDVAIQFKAGIKPDDMTAKMAYIGLEHMPQRSIALSEWSTAETLESNKFQFKQGDILFGKLRSYFHKVGVAPIDGVCSTDIVVVRPKSPEWFGFVLGHVSSSAFVDHTSSGATGTRMPRTNWQDMARYELNMPPIELADEFTALIQPLIDRIIANIHESRTLTALRDTLLPKLMRGEVRVKKQHFMAQHKD